MSRYRIHVEEGPEHGDLFELEQTTWHRVIDTRTGEVVMTFEEEMSARLGSGAWEGHERGGVREVRIGEDDRSVIVTYHGGREERVVLEERER